MTAGILVFPGSNCDADLHYVLSSVYGIRTEVLRYTESFEIRHDFYFIPGGFSYGDYLRSGAMAARTPAVKTLREAAKTGRKIIGICNGFQILTESHLLPGALIRNKDLRHICKWVSLKPENMFSANMPAEYYLPVSHSEGNYIAPEETIRELEDNAQVVFRYRENPNGSMNDIAGIINKEKNIIGLMPHPERAILESDDHPAGKMGYGKYFFDFIFKKF